MTDPTSPSTVAPGRSREDDKLDAELEMTFPASDPLPWIREPPPRERYFEDLRVGQVFRTGTMRVSEAAIKAFAAEFDPQPFHLDAEAARETPFRGLAASGWHTAAVTMRLLVEGEARIAGGLLGLGGQIRWPRATRPGDVLTVESEILEVTASETNPTRGTVMIRNTTLNQSGEVVQVVEMALRVPRRQPG